MNIELNEKGNVLSIDADLLFDADKTKRSSKGNITRAYKKDDVIINDKIHTLQITCYEQGNADAGFDKPVDVVAKKKK